jgi:Deoxynucleoside kinase
MWMLILLVKIIFNFQQTAYFIFTIFSLVYLYTTPETAFKRIQERNRSEEKTISMSYLQNLHDLHEQFIRSGLIKKFCKAPVSLIANLKDSLFSQFFIGNWDRCQQGFVSAREQVWRVWRLDLEEILQHRQPGPGTWKPAMRQPMEANWVDGFEYFNHIM